MFALLQSVFNAFITLITAFSLILIGFVVAKLVQLFLAFSIKGVEIDYLLKKLGFKTLLQQSIPNLAEFAIVIFFFILSFNTLGITKIVFTFFILAIILFSVVYSFFYLTYFSKNLSLSPKLELGKEIQVDNVKGKVINLGINEIIIQSGENKFVIPNSYTTSNKLTIL